MGVTQNTTSTYNSGHNAIVPRNRRQAMKLASPSQTGLSPTSLFLILPVQNKNVILFFCS